MGKIFRDQALRNVLCIVLIYSYSSYYHHAIALIFDGSLFAIENMLVHVCTCALGLRNKNNLTGKTFFLFTMPPP